jgi:hypothetical protein
MLIGSCEEKDFIPIHPFEPGQSIGPNRGIGVPDVGHVVDVIDGGGDVKSLFGFH